MGLEINVWEDRIYSKIENVSLSGWVCTVLIKNMYNKVKDPESHWEFVYNTDTIPTIKEAYWVIKVDPKFKGYYDC